MVGVLAMAAAAAPASVKDFEIEVRIELLSSSFLLVLGNGGVGVVGVLLAPGTRMEGRDDPQL